MLRICALIVLAALPAPGFADVSGPLRVIDADTISIMGTKVRLHGIDALETGQWCGGEGAPAWPCGSWVTGEVRARYDGRLATCHQVDKDRYGRIVARCTVDGRDLGADLVDGGMAFAYRDYSLAYVPHEQAAARRGAGLHGAGVTSPKAFRAAQRRGHAAQHLARAPEGCVIKGNVSSGSGERIYHVPGQAWYQQTVVRADQGERWFCSEVEAVAAGWRRALR